MIDETAVLNCDSDQQRALADLLRRYGMIIRPVALNEAIPGSFFGEREAGLIQNQLYLRPDTPVHSALHEACHYICMDPQRRAQLDTDAEGDYDEENGVCFLQILLSEYVPDMGRSRMLQDMDSWGYSFRLGSAQAWFEEDADDARDWLQRYHIINSTLEPTWQLRQQ